MNFNLTKKMQKCCKIMCKYFKFHIVRPLLFFFCSCCFYCLVSVFLLLLLLLLLLPFYHFDCSCFFINVIAMIVYVAISIMTSFIFSPNLVLLALVLLMLLPYSPMVLLLFLTCFFPLNALEYVKIFW